MTATDKRPYPLQGLLDASHHSPKIDFAASPDCVSGPAQSSPTAGNALALTQLASSRSTAYAPQATQKVQKCSAQYRAGNNPAEQPQQLSKKQFMIKNFFANKSAKSALLAIPNQKLSTPRSLATSYVYSVSQRSGRRSDGVKPRITEPSEKPQTDCGAPDCICDGGQKLDHQLPAQSDGKPHPTKDSGGQEPFSDQENNQGANQSENTDSTAETKGDGPAVWAAECSHTDPKTGSDNPVVAPAPLLPAANGLPIHNLASVPEVDRLSISNATANLRIAPRKLAPAAAASSAVSKQPSPGGSSGRLNLSTVASRCLKSHKVNQCFADRYTIGDELGSGGFGFVVSAIKHPENVEVAVKFICKDKVPMHAWIKDPALGLIPTEIYVLRMVDHPGIIRFVEFFEDPRYFYLVMELHGTPWNSSAAEQKLPPPPRAGKIKQEKSHDGMVTLPLQDAQQPVISANAIGRAEPGAASASQKAVGAGSSKLLPTANPPRPLRKGMVRRSSCDLFECIEQHTRFSEENARYIFAQLADSVYYLKSVGICHRDVKDENIVIDKDLRVKLVDFGSAVVTKHKRVFHLFYGTISYASPEILRGESYHADAAEIWSLGILLYTMLYGEVPFSDPKQAIWDRYAEPKIRISACGVDLLDRMLEKDASKRADVAEVCRHPWLATVPRPYDVRQGVSRGDKCGDDGRQALSGEPTSCSADGKACLQSLPPRPLIPAKGPISRLGEDKNLAVQEKEEDEGGSSHQLPLPTGNAAELR